VKSVLALVIAISSSIAHANSYEYVDLWSSPSERAEWLAWLTSQSSSRVLARYHPVGHLHAFSASIALQPTSPTSQAVLDFLNGPIRVQLGVRPDEIIQFTEQSDGRIPKESAHTVSYDVVTFYRFRVTYRDRPELGKDMVGVVRDNQLVGLMNGHVPSLGKYGGSTVVPLASAVASIENAKGSSVVVESSQLGWVTPSWTGSQKPGNRTLVYLIWATAVSNGDYQYFVVRATDGAVMEQGPTRYQFMPQEHRAYTKTGALMFSNLPGALSCTQESVQCFEPVFSESLLSRSRMTPLSEWVEAQTTPQGGWGVSGTWSTPWFFSGPNPMRPYRTRLTAINDRFVVSLNDISVCYPLAPPCAPGNGWVYAFGKDDTDESVYGHEYAHPFLLAAGKFHRTQVGPDGKMAEGLCDTIGTGFEYMRKVYLKSCPPTVLCDAPRADFLLEAPSLPLTVDMKGPVPTCGQSAREWVGRSFYSSMQSLTQTLYPLACPPNALCGFTTVPNFYFGEQDWATEMLFASLLYSVALLPNFQPNPSDLVAAAMATSVPIAGGASSAPEYLFNQLDSHSAGCP